MPDTVDFPYRGFSTRGGGSLADNRCLLGKAYVDDR